MERVRGTTMKNHFVGHGLRLDDIIAFFVDAERHGFRAAYGPDGLMFSVVNDEEDTLRLYLPSLTDEGEDGLYREMVRVGAVKRLDPKYGAKSYVISHDALFSFKVRRFGLIGALADDWAVFVRRVRLQATTQITWKIEGAFVRFKKSLENLTR